MKIKQLPELERPYEKLEVYGEKSLSNAELLAIIIKTGTREETSVQLAQKILNLNNTTEEDLRYLQRLTIEELMQIKGIGKVKAIQLKAVGEIAIRMFKTNNYKKIQVKNPVDIAKIFMSEMKFLEVETVKIVLLNSKNEIMKIKDVALGGVKYSNVDLMNILVEPLKIKAPKMVLVHNHPTGNKNPSAEDIIFTEKLIITTREVGIELLDHIIIGDMAFTSIFSDFAEDLDVEKKYEIKKKERKGHKL